MFNNSIFEVSAFDGFAVMLVIIAAKIRPTIAMMPIILIAFFTSTSPFYSRGLRDIFHLLL